MIALSHAERIYRFLRRKYKKPCWRLDKVEDPRDAHGKRRPAGHLLEAARLGLLAGQRTIRDVESMTEDLEGWARTLVPERVPYTTLGDYLAELEPDGLRKHLVAQVRDMRRSKQLDPQGLPCGVATLDGKCLAALGHDAKGTGQRHHGEGEQPRYLVRALRTVLSSASCKPCIDQYLIPADTNEMGAFEGAFRQLIATYRRGDYFDVIDVDAGLICKAHAEMIVGEGFAYAARLKQSQPELLAEARRLLEPRIESEAPEAQMPWQRYQGNKIRRSIWRTAEIAQWPDWPHLRQAWVVVTETLKPNGQLKVEHHYWITSLGPTTLTAAQLLRLGRNHWSVENNCYWSLDVLWGEDRHAWCNRGRAAECLGLLRLMAYNVDQFIRKRHVRQRRPRKGDTIDSPWRKVFGWIRKALTSVFAVGAQTEAAVATAV